MEESTEDEQRNVAGALTPLLKNPFEKTPLSQSVPARVVLGLVHTRIREKKFR